MFLGCTKAALDMLGRMMALELGPHNVRTFIFYLTVRCNNTLQNKNCSLHIERKTILYITLNSWLTIVNRHFFWRGAFDSIFNTSTVGDLYNYLDFTLGH